MAYFKVIFRRWEVQLHVFSTVSCSSKGGKKKCIFYPCPKSEEHSWRICQYFTLSPFWRQWQSFLSQNPFCWRLGGGQWENGKVLTSGDLGSLLEMGDLWMGRAFNGRGLELGQGMGKVRGRRQDGEGQPLPFKPSGASLFCQRKKYLSQLQFHLNWVALPLYRSPTVPYRYMVRLVTVKYKGI